MNSRKFVGGGKNGGRDGGESGAEEPGGGGRNGET